MRGYGPVFFCYTREFVITESNLASKNDSGKSGELCTYRKKTAPSSINGSFSGVSAIATEFARQMKDRNDINFMLMVAQPNVPNFFILPRLHRPAKGDSLLKAHVVLYIGSIYR